MHYLILVSTTNRPLTIYGVSISLFVHQEPLFGKGSHWVENDIEFHSDKVTRYDLQENYAWCSIIHALVRVYLRMNSSPTASYPEPHECRLHLQIVSPFLLESVLYGMRFCEHRNLVNCKECVPFVSGKKNRMMIKSIALRIMKIT